ncbi:unnamed protein product [Mytilus coruscus]|uniref:Uncharacterized protein n=1 Tax=Mytilus coruscus TaxID=42192 RepID=A0A6J8DV42_MYTCO|nr:unnamed protein product [Mytilus coruscus]
MSFVDKVAGTPEKLTRMLTAYSQPPLFCLQYVKYQKPRYSMMKNEGYDKVETNDTTPDNIRSSFCRRHLKAVIPTQSQTQSNLNDENRPEVVIKTSNIDKDESTANKCLYYTPEDFVTKLKDDPFAGLCEIGSEFVNQYCNIDKDESSSHLCEECTDGSKLPSFCFCDKKVHCVNDKKLGGRAADDFKKTCNWCADVFNNLGNHRGSASCSSSSQALVKTTCKGYDGFMCSVITTRVCTLKENITIAKISWIPISKKEEKTWKLVTWMLPHDRRKVEN